MGVSLRVKSKELLHNCHFTRVSVIAEYTYVVIVVIIMGILISNFRLPLTLVHVELSFQVEYFDLI